MSGCSSDEHSQGIDTPEPVQEDTMLYTTPDALKAEASYRRDRIARAFRSTAKRSRQHRDSEPKPARHRSPLHLRHAA